MAQCNASCPVCDGDVALADGTVAAEIVVCPECASELEVVALEPAALAPAPAAEEDWGE